MRRTIMITLLLASLLACAKEESELDSSDETPVILISIDTLRSDHLPAYGYDAIETPAIDSLRRDGILYETAYTHCPLTFPAHASILTGLLPSEHGVRDNVGYTLGNENPTLAELLSQNGYQTGAAVSAFVMRASQGIARGFDTYDDDVEAIGKSRAIGGIQRIGSETIEIAEQWISARREQPFFYFLHLYDPHTPYAAPPPFSSRYAEPYDNEIAYVDSVLGGFFEFLKRNGIYDRALIIFLSDHGEGLWQHGEEEHGVFLYREAIQVPLIVKLPGAAEAGRTVETPVQLIDVFPTVARATGSAIDLSGYEGLSLIEMIDSPPAEPRQIYSETYYPKFHFGWSDVHSLTDGRYHYIEAPRPELYDLAEDFEEKENVLDENRRIYIAMRDEIEPFVREAEAPAPVDPEEAAKLAALGYLGSAVRTDPGEPLADPKDRIETIREMKKAFTLFQGEAFDQALTKVDEILAENDRMLDLWELRSKILQRLGRYEEAVAAGRKGLELAPNAHHLMLAVANLSLELMQLDQAEAHAELALSSEPAQALEILARIAMQREDLEKAGQFVSDALEHDPLNVAALITLARLQNLQGNHEQALAAIDEAVPLVKDQDVAGLHFTRGDILARMGRSAEAEKEFREEIRLFPNEPQAYKNLILLLAADGRLQEAAALIRQLVQTSPTVESYLAVCETLQVLGDRNAVRFWAQRGLEKYPNEMELRRYLSG